MVGLNDDKLVRVSDSNDWKWMEFLFDQGWHRLEKYLNLESFLEKSLKVKSALKSTGKSLKGLEKLTLLIEI